MEAFPAMGPHAALAWQFFKYAFFGALATGVDMLVFFACAWKVFPALRADDPVARRLGLHVLPVEEEVRSRRFVQCTVVAFLFSNLTAYLLNVLWVFESGRHSRLVEFLLFLAVSATSVTVGGWLGWLMIRMGHLSTSLSYAGKILAALVLNFVCRKYLVFNG